MPCYEYRCNECGAEFEKMMRFSESDQLPACPQCQGTQTRKKLSAVASFASSDSGANSYGGNCSPRGGFA